MKFKTLLDKKVDILAGITSIFLFLLVWYISTELTSIGKLIPNPVQIVVSVFQSIVGKIGRHTLILHAGYSLARILVGFSIGAILGIILGLSMGWYKPIEKIFQPLFRIIRPIPPIAWIPISIVWFGLGESAKIFLIFLSSFSNVTLNAWAGARSVDPEYVGASRMLGANERQIFLSVVLPSSIPHIFAGLHVAMSSCWATVLAAEMVRSSEGLGWMIVSGMEVNDIVQILTGIVAIGLVGFVLAVIMRKMEDVLCQWNKSGK